MRAVGLEHGSHARGLPDESVRYLLPLPKSTVHLAASRPTSGPHIAVLRLGTAVPCSWNASATWSRTAHVRHSLKRDVTVPRNRKEDAGLCRGHGSVPE